jgi:hypothetical protein
MVAVWEEVEIKMRSLGDEFKRGWALSGVCHSAKLVRRRGPLKTHDVT